MNSVLAPNLTPPHNVAYIGYLGELDSTLRRATDAVCGKGEELTRMARENIDRIGDAMAKMVEDITFESGDEEIGEKGVEIPHTILEGDVTVSVIRSIHVHNRPRLLSCGSEKQKLTGTYYVINGPDGEIEWSHDRSAQMNHCPFEVYSKSQIILSSRDAIDGSNGLQRLGEVNEKLEWLAGICDEIVLRMKSKQSEVA